MTGRGGPGSSLPPDRDAQRGGQGDDPGVVQRLGRAAAGAVVGDAPSPSTAVATATAVHAGCRRRRAARAIGTAAATNARLLSVLAGWPIRPGRIASQSLVGDVSAGAS